MISTLSLLALSAAAYAEDAPPASANGNTGNVRHGVRVGYVYANGAEKAGLDEPHLFALGWEAAFRLSGNGDLDFLLVPNLMFLGMNQGIVIPSANLLVGFAVQDMIEAGAGVNLTLGTEQPLHMIMAVGFTPKVADLQVPFTLSYVPDVDGNWRMGLTTGVNWGAK